MDRPAFSECEWEVALAPEHNRPEWEPPDAALELVGDAELPARVRAWIAEWLPMAAVMNEQLDDDALRRDRPEHTPA
jgi:hypothetical protein